jgi:hypothetical protein
MRKMTSESLPSRGAKSAEFSKIPVLGLKLNAAASSFKEAGFSKVIPAIDSLT